MGSNAISNHTGGTGGEEIVGEDSENGSMTSYEVVTIPTDASPDVTNGARNCEQGCDEQQVENEMSSSASIASVSFLKIQQEPNTHDFATKSTDNKSSPLMPFAEFGVQPRSGFDEDAVKLVQETMTKYVDTSHLASDGSQTSVKQVAEDFGDSECMTVDRSRTVVKQVAEDVDQSEQV